MSFRIETTERFEREFKKLDKYTQRMMKAWIEKNLVGQKDPRAHGKALVADRKGFWRYRIGDYRIICEIKDSELLILALTVGHRREVYKNGKCTNRKTACRRQAVFCCNMLLFAHFRIE